MSVASRSFAFLVNPSSGGGAAPKVVVPLTRALREAGATVEVTYTTSVAETPALVDAAVASGAVVVAVGGDGMLSSVAGAVAARDGVLAVVPAGRGNDFARMLGVPHTTAEQAALLLEGAERRVDLLRATSGDGTTHVVAGSVYAGVDARAGEIVDRSHWLPSKLQYPVAAVRALATYRPMDCVLEVDGVTSRHVAATVVVANSRYYGKGMAIAPDASVSDGLLDVIVIEAASRSGLIRSLPKVYDGGHVALDEVKVHTGHRVTLTGAYAGGGLVPVGADGEALPPLPASGAPLTVELLPEALRIIA
ncbi:MULTISPECIES: diacylglycerol kinase family protein [unclassified Nocardioides]|uniref:diacylglycerol kinase family protein n=1 Tax=unclassified Nocardioides TaxID=2615069 RepID=UPI0007039FD3|nr:MULTISPECIES: diacylglycerol kinase family protein [unclassified Nocardioides]KRC53588.1 diacylglycerol kinase [Nocardioides sp. Root79]KRC67936.1 diacylglycerol kinase [Nocardioides sp. Root240]